MANVEKRDVRVPFAETPSGYLQTVESRELASQRIVVGYSTTPGDVVHRPDWGANLEDYSGRTPTETNLQRLRNQAERFLRTLPFLEAFSVDVFPEGECYIVETDARTLEEELLVPEVTIGV